MGKNIANKEIQLTVQGQTVSSNFGTVDSAQFNIEQLVHAGIANDLFSTRKVTLTKKRNPCWKKWRRPAINPIRSERPSGLHGISE